MSSNLVISNYLNDVLRDWQTSRYDFPNNVNPLDHWPIPFFGNPRNAVVATVGVNPSSKEFAAGRHWPKANEKNRKAWKTRLKNYFNQSIPAYRWFEPWRIGLDLPGASYKQRTAAHFDVSYRPTKAMLKNKRTDPKEFRRMVERDMEWFFRLLSLCPDLRLLLTFGPIVRADGLTESLAKFLRTRAPQNGFVVSQDGGL